MSVSLPLDLIAPNGIIRGFEAVLNFEQQSILTNIKEHCGKKLYCIRKASEILGIHPKERKIIVVKAVGGIMGIPKS